MNPDAPDVLTPLYWLAGTWKSKDFGQGTYPTIKDFQVVFNFFCFFK